MQRDTVFIVDDDASVRDAGALLLSLRGHPVATFASAEDFLAAWQPDWRGCVVADIRMPGLSGLELQRVLHERGAALPVVVITAHGDVATAREAFLRQALDFIEKPFDGAQLVAAVERALAAPRAGAVPPMRCRRANARCWRCCWTGCTTAPSPNAWRSARGRWKCIRRACSTSSAPPAWSSWCGGPSAASCSRRAQARGGGPRSIRSGSGGAAPARSVPA